LLSVKAAAPWAPVLLPELLSRSFLRFEGREFGSGNPRQPEEVIGAPKHKKLLIG